MDPILFGVVATVAIVWVTWLLVRLSWTDTFPITTWRDFIPMHPPERKQ